MEIKKIIEDAIPLDMNCELKRSAEIKRRAKLKIDIEELLRNNKTPYEPPMQEHYKPDLQYKDELITG